MDRRRPVVLAMIVCALCSPVRSSAQVPIPPEGWVVLPVDEYRALRERANPQPPQPANPPVDATLTRVDYDLRVENESVAGRAVLTIDVLRDGWTRVQIPAGLMVRDARLDGQPVSLVEGPPPYVLLSRAGRVVLSLDIVVPLTSSAGTESIALPPSPAPISRAVFALSRSGVDLSVVGGFVGEHTETPLESRWTTLGRPNQPLTLSWKRKIDDRRAEQALRTRARVTTLVGGQRHRTEARQGPCSGLGRGQAFGDELLGLPFEMEGELLVQFAFDAAPREQRARAQLPVA